MADPTRGAALRIQTYRDGSRSRHFNLIAPGEHQKWIGLILVPSSGILVAGAAPMVPLTLMVTG
jgi:hypothetical protein